MQHTLTENSATENPLITSPTKTTLIHKALKKLMNGHTPSVNDDITDNNNEEVTESDGNIAEVEEEEEALSESEIPDDSIRGIDFQTMYHSFMSGSVSEDSDGSKDNVGNLIGVNSDDNQIGNLSFSDSNNSAK